MNYQETINYLYESVPMFQQIGSDAYKEGLENTHQLDQHFGHPHAAFRTIHIAGTNGKGSCSHTLAAILQAANYRVGLYTSPHLIDFRERIRVNGEPISESYVVDFVENHRPFFEPLHPSFFELTTAMAFRYFSDAKIDVAIIETGMGGRLDCTNIIRPDLCVITNISLDHTQFLGDTLEKIAIEKAGIMKEDTPVVIGSVCEETRAVFAQKASEKDISITFAAEKKKVNSVTLKGALKSSTNNTVGWIYDAPNYPELEGELGGLCQVENTNTILHALEQLQTLGYQIEEEHVRKGFSKVCELTGLMGRWQKLGESPLVICDTGHNKNGFEFINKQLSSYSYRQLHMVIGMVSDKDIEGVLALLPQEAIYYFTKASIKRALPEEELKAKAQPFGLEGDCYPTVFEAVQAAKNRCLPEDFIFVGGSSFIVADLLTSRNALDLD